MYSAFVGQGELLLHKSRFELTYLTGPSSNLLWHRLDGVNPTIDFTLCSIDLAGQPALMALCLGNRRGRSDKLTTPY